MPQFPYTLGREAEGHVAAVGADVSGYKVGDRVVYLGTSAQAEYTAVEPLHLTHVPEGVKPGVAAAAILQGLTAVTMVREAYAVKKVCYYAVGGTLRGG